MCQSLFFNKIAGFRLLMMIQYNVATHFSSASLKQKKSFDPSAACISLFLKQSKNGPFQIHVVIASQLHPIATANRHCLVQTYVCDALNAFFIAPCPLFLDPRSLYPAACPLNFEHFCFLIAIWFVPLHKTISSSTRLR